MTQQPWTGSRRVLLALGGLSLLSACAKPPRPEPQPAASAVTPATYRPSPTPSPSPTPTGPARIPVQKEPRYVVPAGRGAKVVALTFDDGPHPAYTPQVLKLLRKHHITATFFVIGQEAAAHPDLVRAIAADGHTIGTHTWSHVDLKRQTAGRVKTEVGRAVDTVAATTGRAPALFRAPYGSWSKTAFQVCAALGQTSIAWDVDPRDWDNPGASRIRSKILNQVGNRSIVLTHDGGGDRSETVRALRGVLPVLLDSGYRFVGV